MKAHPIADLFPMLPEDQLRDLADSIAAGGLDHPIVLDADGRILDGRNRYAACQIAGVEPRFVTYDGGDPIGYALRANIARREMTAGAKAVVAVHAENLDSKSGRELAAAIGISAGTIAQARTIVQWAPTLVDAVIEGRTPFDRAYSEATAAKRDAKRIADLPDDLRALVESGVIDQAEAEQRADLPADYAERVARGDLTTAEATQLATRDERERSAAIERQVNHLRNFLDGWNTFAHLDANPLREEVLERLDEHQRARLHDIQEAHQ